MRKTSNMESAAVLGVASFPDDLGPAIQDELAALADIDVRYDALRGRLNQWPGEQALKERWARELNDHHRREREPHVIRLAHLHQQTISATMFRSPQAVH